MTTIMSGGGATGGPSGGDRRCDGKCHTAKTTRCNCICGGRYHGAGSSQIAQEQLTTDWLGEDWRQEFGQYVQGDLPLAVGGTT